MKKIVSVCMLIVTILSYLVVTNIYQTKDYEQLIRMGETSTSFKVYVQDSKIDPQDEVDFFNYLAHKDNATFILTTNGKNGIIEKSIVTNNSSFPSKSFRLKKANFKNKRNFYASYKTSNPYQQGIIPTFSSKNKVLLQTMNSFFGHDKKNADGIYTVVSNPKNKYKIVKELATFYQVSSKKLLTPTANYQIEYANQQLYILLIIILISVLVFILVTIYLPISQIRTIGIQKLNGWDNKTIFFSLIKNGLITIIGTAFILDILSCLINNYLPPRFILTCVFVQILVVFLYFIANIFSFILVKRMTIADLLKNRYHFDLGVIATYLLKILMSIATVVFLIATSSSINVLIKQYNIQQEWKENGNVLTLKSLSTSSLNNENEANHLMTNWYKTMNKQNGVYYVNSQAYRVMDVLPEGTVSSNSLNRKNINVMTVNANFLKDHYSKLNDGHTDFWVPIELKNKRPKYLLQCFKYNELSSKEQEKNKI